MSAPPGDAVLFELTGETVGLTGPPARADRIKGESVWWDVSPTRRCGLRFVKRRNGGFDRPTGKG